MKGGNWSLSHHGAPARISCGNSTCPFRIRSSTANREGRSAKLMTINVDSVRAGRSRETFVPGVLAQEARRHWLEMVACAEPYDLASPGIGKASCVDGSLVSRILGYPFPLARDRKQRSKCGCAAGIDILTRQHNIGCSPMSLARRWDAPAALTPGPAKASIRP